ncbi:MAG: cytochrome ubiquinol oxidase subunit I, partial [Burkholderiaceae bacterium]
MDTFDPILLARIQFAANITFHILFPSISLALGWLLLFFKWRFNRTGQALWMDSYQFWVKVFALTFALGVVSGITMSFQFGTNWPGFMETVGNVAGPLLAYEVLTAFFLEATMLGIMLFGRGRVSERIHTLATFLVAAGTTASAFWILVLNSWMHTPAGFEMINGQAHVTDWLAVIFNPSFPYRFTHMMLASGLTVGCLVAGLSAYRWLKGQRTQEVRQTWQVAIWVVALLIPVQIVVGDLHGLNTLVHQPAKIAAMEGIWKTEKGAPAVLFGVPDASTQSNRFEIAIPKLASLYLTHDWNGEVKGIDAFGANAPPVAPIFYAFRIMVGMGLAMLALGWLSAWRVWRGRPMDGWWAKAWVAMTFAGWIGLVAGWYVTEVGRQPWLVSGVLTTAQAASSV